VIPEPPVLAAFGLKESEWQADALSRGHINASFVLSEKESAQPRYLLQKINTYVFRDPDILMENMLLVTETIRRSNTEAGLDPDRYGLTLIPANDGRLFYTDENGQAWRLLIYINDHLVYDVINDDTVAEEGGRAYGNFFRQLSLIDPGKLKEVINHFHDLEFRYQQFTEALEHATEERKVSADEEISETIRQWEHFKKTPLLSRDIKLPIRVTHNDTKINNLLFDTDGKALCVLDLDTVMPGLVHYDFGDAIRTAAATAKEDVEDTSLMKLSFARFAAFSKGYLSEVAGVLSQAEEESLYLAPSYFAFIMGLRFLTDYLSGDKYFNILWKNHNLQRTKAQYALLRDMQMNELSMREELRSLFRQYK